MKTISPAVDVPTPESSFCEAATLANDLAELAADYQDARLARAATDALELATSLRNFCEFLAELAGVES
jgi:hypothetical protein